MQQASADSDKLRQAVILTMQKGDCLVQVWQPGVEIADEGVKLQTKGSAVALAGRGEGLADFRRRCCQYQLDVTAIEQDPVCTAWQRKAVVLLESTSKDAHQPHVQDLRACGLKGACFLPVLRADGDMEPLAVLEAALDALSTATVFAIERQLRLSAEVAGLLVPPGCHCAAPPLVSQTPQLGRPVAVGKVAHQGNASQGSLAGQQCSNADSRGEDGDHIHEPHSLSDSDGEREQAGPSADYPGSSGAPGNPWDLQIEDIEKYFSFGLKEAAMRLGICTTTLKRICRQHGINKWPRRDILRNQRALLAARLAQEPPASHHGIYLQTPPTSDSTAMTAAVDAPARLIPQKRKMPAASIDNARSNLSPAENVQGQRVAIQPTAANSRQPSPRPSGRRPRQIDALPAHASVGNSMHLLDDIMPTHLPSSCEQGSEQTAVAPVVIDHNMLQRRKEFEALMLSWMRECEAAEDHPLLADALFDANALLQDLQGDAALPVPN